MSTCSVFQGGAGSDLVMQTEFILCFTGTWLRSANANRPQHRHDPSLGRREQLSKAWRKSKHFLNSLHLLLSIITISSTNASRTRDRHFLCKVPKYLLLHQRFENGSCHLLHLARLFRTFLSHFIYKWTSLRYGKEKAKCASCPIWHIWSRKREPRPGRIQVRFPLLSQIVGKWHSGWMWQWLGSHASQGVRRRPKPDSLSCGNMLHWLNEEKRFLHTFHFFYIRHNFIGLLTCPNTHLKRKFYNQNHLLVKLQICLHINTYTISCMFYWTV